MAIAEKTNLLGSEESAIDRELKLFSEREIAKNVKSNSSSEFYAMGKELEELIGRFESTLLAAEANREFLSKAKGKDKTTSSAKKKSNRQELASISSVKPLDSSVNGAVLEARKKLQLFLQLVERKQYAQARQQWFEAQKLILDNYPVDRQIAQAEVRAIWLDRGTIVQSKSEADLARIFDRLAAAGINTVFFETLNASYTIYPSKVAPEQNPLVKGWDPLKSAVKLAHDRGMELHAWIWAFAAANQAHNSILSQPAGYLGPVLSLHPDWAMLDKQGRIFDPQSKKAFLDPAHPEVKNYLLSLIEEIATRYQVDGIQLDYIRYPFQDPKADRTFGYSNAARQAFMRAKGVDPLKINFKHPLWQEWTRFRTQQVDDFVSSASQRLKAKRPDLILSAAVFPMSRSDRMARLQQNWEEWAEKKWIHMLVPMTYVIDTPELQQKTQSLFSASFPKTTLLLPGIRLLNVPEVVIVDKMQLLRHLPAGGYALFAADNFNSTLQKILNATQGSTTLKQPEPIPHRQPFQAAASRYQALQREWDYLLANNQLPMDKVSMKEWKEQVGFLSGAFDRLASEPTSRQILSVQITLESFQRNFGTWMAQFNKTRPYQVQAWANRLDALDRLIGYGAGTLPDRTRAKVGKR